MQYSINMQDFERQNFYLCQVCESSNYTILFLGIESGYKIAPLAEHVEKIENSQSDLHVTGRQQSNDMFDGVV
jgi:hypothetical protein